MTELGDGREERAEDKGQQTAATSKRSGSEKLLRRIVGRVIEVTILTVVIAVVWGLFSLPTVFFFVDNKGNSVPSDSSPTCTPFVYTGQLCFDALLSRQQCIPGRENTTDIYIQSKLFGGLSPTQIEGFFENFESFIDFQPSPECIEMLAPFLCSYIFAPCSDTGQLHLPSEQECVSLRDGVCMLEWQEITSIHVQQGLAFLPECEKLPSLSLICPSFPMTMAPSESENTSLGTPSVTPVSNMPTIFNITCSKDFYLDTTAGYCKPECGQWKPFPDDVVVANAVLIIMSSAGLVSGVFIVIVSILKYRHMLEFPAILILYQSTDVAIFLFVVLIGYMDTQTFLCPSQDATNNFGRTTAYCILSGIINHYFLNQAITFWVAHIVAVLLTILFPFQARSLKDSKQYKIIHAVVVVAALVFPIGFVAAPLGTGGFSPFYYPNTCVAMNSSMSYYTLILPISILSAIGVSFLVLLFWVLIRRKWKNIIRALSKKSIRKHGIWAYLKDNPTHSAIPATALVKVILSFLCYMTASILGIASSASLFRVQSKYTEELTEYFICESSGNNSARVCNKSYEDLYNPLPTSVSIFLLGIVWQSVNLLYVLNFKDLYSYIKTQIRPVAFSTHASATVTSTV